MVFIKPLRIHREGQCSTHSAGKTGLPHTKSIKLNLKPIHKSKLKINQDLKHPTESITLSLVTEELEFSLFPSYKIKCQNRQMRTCETLKFLHTGPGKLWAKAGCATEAKFSHLATT